MYMACQYEVTGEFLLRRSKLKTKPHRGKEGRKEGRGKGADRNVKEENTNKRNHREYKEGRKGL